MPEDFGIAELGSLAGSLSESVGAAGAGETVLGTAAGAASADAGAGALAAGEGGTSFGESLAEGAPTAESVAASGLGIGQAVGATSGASSFSWPTLSQIGGAGNIASSLYGMDQTSQLRKLAMMQANKATPWQTAGGGDAAAQQLLALISGKTDVSTLPGYGAGLQAVQRSGAANGWLGSGNMMAALQQYGGQFYNNAVSQLSGLSGAQFNPATAGSLAVGGATNSAALNLAAMSNINKTATTLGA